MHIINTTVNIIGPTAADVLTDLSLEHPCSPTPMSLSTFPVPHSVAQPDAGFTKHARVPVSEHLILPLARHIRGPA